MCRKPSNCYESRARFFYYKKNKVFATINLFSYITAAREKEWRQSIVVLMLIIILKEVMLPLAYVSYGTFPFLSFRAIAMLCSIMMDRWLYGQWVAVQYEFIRFNIVHNVAAFYGIHPWHWYLTQVCGPLNRCICF